jgi:translation initiation factor 1 (eIF-1/SUI1)
MPKRGKKKSGDGREQYEGRPAELTFAAFLPTAIHETQTAFSQENHETASTSAEAQTQDDILPTEFLQSSERAQEYTVTRTKKGKLPITYENRSKGKKVTVISNISGNAEQLLAELRRRLGVGGVSRGAFIELQGDQQKFVEQFLNKHPCVK